MKISHLPFVLLLLFCPALSQGQSNYPEGRTIEGEKLYITTDRYLFEPGEALNYSLMVLNDSNVIQRELNLVKIFLDDPGGKIIDSVTAKVIGGRYSNQFYLPRKGGIYTIRASTNYQNNDLKPKPFTKEIYVQRYLEKRFFVHQESQRSSYVPGDSLLVEVKVTEPGDMPIDGLTCHADLIVNGTILNTLVKQSNQNGILMLHFLLPDGEAIEDAYVRTWAEFRGDKESASLRVPILKNDVHFSVYLNSGGQRMLAGKKNELVVASYDPLGNPKDIEGWIEDDEGNKVTTFKSLHNGMARVEITPKLNQKYRVKSKHSSHQLELPKADSSAITMTVVERNDSLEVIINGNVSENAYLRIVGNGSLLDKTAIRPDKRKVLIAQSRLRQGVYGIALFDNNQILAKRLWAHTETAGGSFEIEAKDYINVGDPLSVQVKNKDKSGSGRKAYINMRVLDEQTLHQIKDRSHSIQSWLFIGSEITSQIEDPTFYLDPSKPNRKEALDLLMVANQNNWRRSFRDGRVIAQTDRYYPRLTGKISGRVHDALHYHQSLKKPVLVRIKNTTYEVMTDSVGRFSFEGLPSEVVSSSVMLVVKKGIERTEVPVTQHNMFLNTQFGAFQSDKGWSEVEIPAGPPLGPNNIRIIQTEGLRTSEVIVKRNASMVEQPMEKYYVDGIPVAGRRVSSLACLVTIPAYEYYNEIDYQLITPFGPGYSQQFYVNLDRSYYRFRLSKDHGYFGGEKTVYWHGRMETDVNGSYSLNVQMPQKNGSFVVIAEGVTSEGEVIYASKTVRMRDDIEVSHVAPKNLTSGDKAMAVFQFRSYKKTGSWVSVTTVQDSKSSTDSVWLEAGEMKKMSVPVEPRFNRDVLHFSYSYLFDGKHRSSERYQIPIGKVGHKRSENVSSSKQKITKRFTASTAYEGSQTIKFSVLSDFTKLIEDVSQRMIRQPHGCFEQVSSSNYPNLLALKVLRHNKGYNDMKLIGYINSGYQQLVRYETPSKGFEWYGRNPPHEALTAYGLLQFSIMKELGLTVNQEMYQRNLDWLLSRRDGRGGFKNHSGRYGFSGVGPQTHSAYITWVLSRITNLDLSSEIEAMEKEQARSFNAYNLALLANVYVNRGIKEKAQWALDTLIQHLKENAFSKFTSTGSVMRSYGRSLDVEIMALTLLAIHKNENGYSTIQPRLASEILKRRTYNGFGSTQSTALALEALSTMLDYFDSEGGNQNYQVTLNGKPVLEYAFSDDSHQEKKILVDHKLFKLGDNVLEVTCESSQPLPYFCELNWAENNASVQHPELGFDYALDKNDLNQSDWSYAEVTISNRTDQTKPQTVAVVHIPGGCTYSMEELRALKKDGELDYFETKNNQLMLYFLHLKPNETKHIKFAIQAKIPGTYQTEENYVYQYYTPEIKSSILTDDLHIKPSVTQ
ncbi:MAG: hypothetical protein JJ975_00105 [Bacteroidia bacterium]|nr:hypothetical protein [Bacteroidia bacterium]